MNQEKSNPRSKKKLISKVDKFFDRIYDVIEIVFVPHISYLNTQIICLIGFHDNICLRYVEYLHELI